MAYTKELRIFFLIKIKDGDQEELSNKDEKLYLLSNQEFKCGKLFQSVAVKDESTGKYKIENIPLIAVNYDTFVNATNGFAGTANITINHHTKTGIQSTNLNLELNKYKVYEDDKVKVICGIADLIRISTKLPKEEQKALDKKNAEIINTIVDGKGKINTLFKDNGEIPTDEPEV